ncbi:hypothetical protein [Deinococcus fonticola]|uniref:hypothetical protein n=1 Tax=Deinococcus fonticola TaxID=2528713 RepID=UPI00142F8EFE|nr:hypothetical protein [Deinococcus fonticola]
MPIVFIHGVAVRREGDPGWEQVAHATRGVDWQNIHGFLREHVAPVLNPAHPGDVPISELYWGDLGASYGLGGRSLASGQAAAGQAAGTDHSNSELNWAPEALGERLEEDFCRAFPTSLWPEVMAAAWSVARDTNLLDIARSLAPERQLAFLRAAVESRLDLPRQDLREMLEAPRLPRRLVLERRRNLKLTFSTVRRPIEDFVPLFLGDVLSYLGGRGLPAQPGVVMRRVLGGLKAARLDSDPAEPLVVLTHSMGGQLLYDALTSFLPADPDAPGVRVDFWCACGSQVGLFRELGQFLERGPLPTPALLNSPHLGYFWNVWSFSDFLSFRAEGIIQGAHDTAFPFLGNVRSDHLSYLTHANFYRALAAKVKIHTEVSSRSTRPPSLDFRHDET